MIFNMICKRSGTSTTSSVPNIITATPAEIHGIAQSGLAQNYYSIGDVVAIPLSGTVRSLKLDETYYAFIIGFDHNAEIEGYNTIHLQFGKTANFTDIAFVDSKYGPSTTSSSGFVANASLSTSGGWKSSYIRTTCEKFLATISTDWQNIIINCPKYSHNGDSSYSDSKYVTSTSDKIWLLSEYEVFGKRRMANAAEQNYQQQYDYYANGGSRVKHKHTETSTVCIWWLRSVYLSTQYERFCAVSTTGTSSGQDAYHSLGFAPGFAVG